MMLLHCAAKNGFALTARALLSHVKVDLNTRDGLGQTAHEVALAAGHDDLRKLLRDGLSDFEDSEQLQVAAALEEFGGSEVGALVRRKEGDLEWRGSEGDTALHLAVKAGCLLSATFLLQGRADVAAVGAEHSTALNLGAASGNEDIVKQLLLHRANPALEDNEGRQAAALAQNQKVVAALQQESTDSDLLVAAQQGASSSVGALLRAKADANEVNEEGATALHLAVQAESELAVALLLLHKADPERREAQGRRALHIAVQLGCGTLVQRLMDAQADVSATDNSGSTAFDLAKLSMKPSVAGLLSAQF